jgi:hypothetical protein
MTLLSGMQRTDQLFLELFFDKGPIGQREGKDSSFKKKMPDKENSQNSDVSQTLSNLRRDTPISLPKQHQLKNNQGNPPRKPTKG